MRTGKIRVHSGGSRTWADCGQTQSLNQESVSFLGEIVGFGLFYSADVGCVDKKFGMYLHCDQPTRDIV